MNFSLLHLPWPAVGLAIAFGFLSGGLWYGPGFGRTWLRALGRAPEHLGSPERAMAANLAAQSISVLALALLVQSLNLTRAPEGASLGLLIGLCVIAPALASDAIYCGHAARLWQLQAAYRTLCTLVTCTLLAAWR